MFLAPEVHAAVWNKAQTGAYGQTYGSATAHCTFASHPALGDTILVGFATYFTSATSTTITSVKDSNNNSYTISPQSPIFNADTNTTEMGIAYLLSAPSNASNTITVTWGKASTGGHLTSIWCDDFSLSSGYVAVFDSDATATGTTDSVNAPTTSVSGNDIVYSTVSTKADVTALNSPWLDGGGAGGGLEAYSGYVANTTSPVAANMTTNPIVPLWASMEEAIRASSTATSPSPSSTILSLAKGTLAVGRGNLSIY